MVHLPKHPTLQSLWSCALVGTAVVYYARASEVSFASDGGYWEVPSLPHQNPSESMSARYHTSRARIVGPNIGLSERLRRIDKDEEDDDGSHGGGGGPRPRQHRASDEASDAPMATGS